jgi:threonine/homoserine/homoserine lactone efflux protein
MDASSFMADLMVWRVAQVRIYRFALAAGNCISTRTPTLDFIPSLSVLAAFSLGAVILVMTPGPDMTLFLGRTLSGGRRLGFAAMLGAASGLVVHALLAGFGLSALLAASSTAFTVLKIIGAAYLLWLAWGALRHGSSLSLLPGGAPESWLATYLTGVGINLTNPKVVFFFLTFLPQFVEASDPHASGKLLFLGLYFLVIGVPLCSALILIASRFAAAARANPRAMRIFDYGFAGLMSAFAARLLLAQSR